jgi:hypothetical protein
MRCRRWPWLRGNGGEWQRDGEMVRRQWLWWSFPSLQRLPLDRTRVRTVGISGGGEPRTLCPWSPPPLYSTARQGPTSLAWAGRPRSGRGSRAQWAVGPIGGEINLTFSPLISSYTFNFILWNNSFQSIRSITDLHVEHVSSSRSIPDRINTYNTLLCLETDSLTLGPFIVRKSKTIP